MSNRRLLHRTVHITKSNYDLDGFKRSNKKESTCAEAIETLYKMKKNSISIDFSSFKDRIEEALKQIEKTKILE